MEEWGMPPWTLFMAMEDCTLRRREPMLFTLFHLVGDAVLLQDAPHLGRCLSGAVGKERFPVQRVNHRDPSLQNFLDCTTGGAGGQDSLWKICFRVILCSRAMRAMSSYSGLERRTP